MKYEGKIKTGLKNPDIRDVTDEFNNVADLLEYDIIEHGDHIDFVVPNALGTYDLIYVHRNKCYWHGRVTKEELTNG
jgi:hypothetical protein